MCWPWVQSTWERHEQCRQQDLTAFLNEILQDSQSLQQRYHTQSDLHKSRSPELWKLWIFTGVPFHFINRPGRKRASHLPVTSFWLWQWLQTPEQVVREPGPSLQRARAVQQQLSLASAGQPSFQQPRPPLSTTNWGESREPATQQRAPALQPSPISAAFQLCRKWEPVTLPYLVQLPFWSPSPSQLESHR